MDPDCATSADPGECGTLGSYDPTMSSTSMDTYYPFEITYGSGNVAGTYYVDTVLLAGKTLKPSAYIRKTDRWGI